MRPEFELQNYLSLRIDNMKQQFVKCDTICDKEMQALKVVKPNEE